MSFSFGEGRFLQIPKNEQLEILEIIQNFGKNVLEYSEDWVYIASIFQKDKNTSIKICSYSSGLGIEDDIYLRFGRYGYDNRFEKKIVVARIGFKKQENGFGTTLLKTLCEIGERYNYISLHIEQPNPGCKIFMHKIGFEKDNYLSIAKLKESIEQYERRKRIEHYTT